MRFSLSVAATTGVLVLLACGGSDTAPKTSTLSIGRDSTLLVDEVETLAAISENGTQLSASSLTWSSSAPNVASVDARGRVTALSMGQTSIAATSPSASAHVTITVAAQFAQISAGEYHTCGITGRREVYCWGTSFDGELGSAPLVLCEGAGYCSTRPALATQMRFSSIVAGGKLTCGVDASGAAYCWGNNVYGQLGDGTMTPNSSPQLVAGGHHFAQLIAGLFHVCGITTEQDAYCWGSDDAGQLGTGDVSEESCATFTVDPCSSSPRLVAGAHKWKRLAANEETTCGVDTTGLAYCWGFASGSTDTLPCAFSQGCVHTPIQVEGIGELQDISMGVVDQCAQAGDGTIKCWGRNLWGSFGNGTNDSSATPVPAARGLAYATFVMSEMGACALDSSGHAQCWGGDDSGEAGNGLYEAEQSSPGPLRGGYYYVTLSAGSNSEHVCGLAKTGRALCWGNGGWGQLGNGSLGASNAPQLVQLVPTPPPAGSIATTR